jgi:hypothetical protein
VIPTIGINLGLILVAALSDNETLIYHSYLLYGAQFLSVFAFLLRRTSKVKDLFMPSFFVLFYFLVNLTLGSYLVPRGYGWNKEFWEISLNIRSYTTIVTFLLMANLVLFLLTAATLRRTRALEASANQSHDIPSHHSAGLTLLRSVVFFATFLVVSYMDVYSAFSFQLALLILHLTDPGIRRTRFRFLAYAYYLGVLLAFSFENKREIAMVLFLAIFVEAYYRRNKLNFTFRSIAAYSVGGASFFALVMAASIMRGYGAFPVQTIVDAVTYIPQYLTSEFFIDGITDNLELNYSYGVTITSMDHTIRSLIPYQLGGSLIKVLFLPVPRELFPFKPESIMQVFTQEYAPDYWAADGSLPVMFAADAFINFHYLGLVAYAAVFYAINRLFLKFHTAKPNSVCSNSCLFLCITVLMFARGSGLEQWLLYYLLGSTVFLAVRIAGNHLRADLPGASRWVV